MSDAQSPLQRSGSDANVLKITAEDLATIAVPVTTAFTPAASTTGATVYGNINDTPADPSLPEEKASIWVQGWLYLGVAGLAGALAGWGICERGFVDGGNTPHRWGNTLMLPVIVAMMCVAFGAAESIVERSARKGLIRSGLGLGLGIVLGFVFDFAANMIYGIGLSLVSAFGVQSYHNPSVWIARGLGWAAFGTAGGVVYGIIGKSGKKVGYGALGGAIGAFLGGVIFDPISFATKGGAPSRAVGFALFGLATGIAMGLVESALKDRWLYVTAGPLAGKQFILYKPVTTLGSNQQTDIYLFKDAEILPAHATLHLKGSRVYVEANGPVYVGGSPVRGTHVLETGSVLRIGRYGFRYQEKQR